MFLNERAWNAEQENKYVIIEALKEFLCVYKELIYKYKVEGIFVPDNQERMIRSSIYPLDKWLAETDIEYRRMFLSFWDRRIIYHPEEEFEFLYNGERIEGATEAILSDSFIISPCITETWKVKELEGKFFSLYEDSEQELTVINVYNRDQLAQEDLRTMLERHTNITISSYDELWQRREKMFPHLEFCPSVKKNLQELECTYITQVVKKLYELERYCENNEGKPFDKDALSKTTLESEATLQKYRTQHTFYNEDKVPYLASWHMRFTGIPGRIFFIPDYKEKKMLICYIGEKLKNVTYN